MAMQETSPSTAPSAQMVGNAFVEQYYHILHQSPDLVHRFYQDSSLLSRSDSNGVMKTVTTTKAINETIVSLNYEDCTAEIKTADAQESHEKGVIVLVTGCLTGKDNVRKKFSQTFFLAPQDKGYYVLNDVFRFIEENDSPQLNSASINVINENAETVHMLESGYPATSAEDEKINNSTEVYHPRDNKEEGSVIDEEVAIESTDLSQKDIVTIHDSTSAVQDDARKTSYASIVMKSNTASGHVYVPSRAARVASAKSNEQWHATAKSTPGPEALAPSGESVPGSSDFPEAEGHSIYIRNLPFNATIEQLEEVFKKFGPIKHGGVQVRSSKHGFCFGFVEFEESSSMHSALKASPITVGERQAVIEEKISTTRVSDSGRGRYPSGRGGFRGENFRGRGRFGGGRGYGRSEFRNQGEFSGRPRSSQRPRQNGGGRGERHGVGNHNVTPSTSV
ncbi:nuclear transport factor 2 [Cicer arietinum]|uniref:Ras GTPase-activating protein-binding protein 1 n=1 Tax=Cicer arietinum TaxID=3827 RepID=A0A3Q7XG21_CICAR|nr:ras GTPase-activating protein-binding protein 1 [Cicer arietinum]